MIYKANDIRPFETLSCVILISLMMPAMKTCILYLFARFEIMVLSRKA